jgi:hypothetical protein
MAGPIIRSRGVREMCDYSLHAVASRPAKIGDKLVTTQFPSSFTRGLAAVKEPEVAVCLLPGTEVAFDQKVKYAHPLGWCSRTTKEKLARFRQVNLDNSHTHHDAFELPSGKIVMVTRLVRNQSLTVLQLPITAHDANDAVQQKHASTIEAQSAPLLAEEAIVGITF